MGPQRPAAAIPVPVVDKLVGAFKAARRVDAASAIAKALGNLDPGLAQTARIDRAVVERAVAGLTGIGAAQGDVTAAVLDVMYDHGLVEPGPMTWMSMNAATRVCNIPYKAIELLFADRDADAVIEPRSESDWRALLSPGDPCADRVVDLLRMGGCVSATAPAAVPLAGVMEHP